MFHFFGATLYICRNLYYPTVLYRITHHNMTQMSTLCLRSLVWTSVSITESFTTNMHILSQMNIWYDTYDMMSHFQPSKTTRNKCNKKTHKTENISYFIQRVQRIITYWCSCADLCSVEIPQNIHRLQPCHVPTDRSAHSRHFQSNNRWLCLHTMQRWCTKQTTSMIQ